LCRYGGKEREKFCQAIEQSKKLGKSIEVERMEVEGFLLPPGVFLTYLYTDPNTNRDMYVFSPPPFFLFCFFVFVCLFVCFKGDFKNLFKMSCPNENLQILAQK
jgi:hypothetical protein